MIAYGIDYHIRDNNRQYSILIEAKDIQSAKRKIARKHKKKDGTPFRDGRVVKLDKVSIIGYL